MTRAEKTQIAAALDLLMQDDGDFHQAISILCKLAGMHYPAARVLDGAKDVDVFTVAKRPNQQFKVARPSESPSVPGESAPVAGLADQKHEH
jgi:hypothetical protein